MTHPATRSGLKSSETWGYVLFVATVLASGSPWLDIPAEHVLLVFTAAGAHGVSRTTLKNTLAKVTKP